MSGVRTHFTLNTGQTIPAIGFGTWKAEPGAAGKAVQAAFDAGYRHFVCSKDTEAGFRTNVYRIVHHFVGTNSSFKFDEC